MKVRVVSKSGNRNFALDPDNVIAATYGATGFEDARSCAVDHAKSGEGPAWIYEAELTCLGVMKEERTVAFIPADQTARRVTLDGTKP